MEENLCDDCLNNEHSIQQINIDHLILNNDNDSTTTVPPLDMIETGSGVVILLERKSQTRDYSRMIIQLGKLVLN